jgi:hypothetical protein
MKHSQPALQPELDTVDISDHLERALAEFDAFPGMALTAPQMQRLWSLTALECAALLDALTTSRYLHVTAAGTYTRREPRDAGRIR